MIILLLSSLPRLGPLKAHPCPPSSPPSSLPHSYTMQHGGNMRTSHSTLTMAPFIPLAPHMLLLLLTSPTQSLKSSPGSTPLALSLTPTKWNLCSFTHWAATLPTRVPPPPSLSPSPTPSPWSFDLPQSSDTSGSSSCPHSTGTLTLKHWPTMLAALSSAWVSLATPFEVSPSPNGGPSSTPSSSPSSPTDSKSDSRMSTKPPFSAPCRLLRMMPTVR